MELLAQFFAGAFLCNCIPHLVAGLQGAPFPSPFASPPGKGDSYPLTNFLWGSFNLGAGLGLLVVAPIELGLNLATVIAAGGFLLCGSYMAYHFGKLRQEEAPEPDKS